MPSKVLDLVGRDWTQVDHKGSVGQLASGLFKWIDRHSYCQRVDLCTVWLGTSHSQRRDTTLLRLHLRAIGYSLDSPSGRLMTGQLNLRTWSVMLSARASDLC